MPRPITGDEAKEVADHMKWVYVEAYVLCEKAIIDSPWLMMYIKPLYKAVRDAQASAERVNDALKK